MPPWNAPATASSPVDGMKIQSDALPGGNRLDIRTKQEHSCCIVLIVSEGSRDPRRYGRSRYAGVARPVLRHGGGVGPDHRDAVARRAPSALPDLIRQFIAL